MCKDVGDGDGVVTKKPMAIYSELKGSEKKPIYSEPCDELSIERGRDFRVIGCAAFLAITTCTPPPRNRSRTGSTWTQQRPWCHRGHMQGGRPRARNHEGAGGFRYDVAVAREKETGASLSSASGSSIHSASSKCRTGRIFDQPSHLPLFTRQDRHIQQLKPLLNAIIVVFFRTTPRLKNVWP